MSPGAAVGSKILQLSVATLLRSSRRNMAGVTEYHFWVAAVWTSSSADCGKMPRVLVLLDDNAGGRHEQLESGHLQVDNYHKCKKTVVYTHVNSDMQRHTHRKQQKS